MSADRRVAAKEPKFEDLRQLYNASLKRFDGRQTTNQSDGETEKGIVSLDHEYSEVCNALKSIESATKLAALVHEQLPKDPQRLSNSNISPEIVELLFLEQASDVCRADRIRYLYISACASDVLQAIDELDSILSVVTFILSLVIFGEHVTFHSCLCANSVQ